jgi:hypothetical protein
MPLQDRKLLGWRRRANVAAAAAGAGQRTQRTLFSHGFSVSASSSRTGITSTPGAGPPPPRNDGVDNSGTGSVVAGRVAMDDGSSSEEEEARPEDDEEDESDEDALMSDAVRCCGGHGHDIDMDDVDTVDDDMDDGTGSGYGSGRAAPPSTPPAARTPLRNGDLSSIKLAGVGVVTSAGGSHRTPGGSNAEAIEQTAMRSGPYKGTRVLYFARPGDPLDENDIRKKRKKAMSARSSAQHRSDAEEEAKKRASRESVQRHREKKKRSDEAKHRSDAEEEAKKRASRESVQRHREKKKRSDEAKHRSDAEEEAKKRASRESSKKHWEKKKRSDEEERKRNEEKAAREKAARAQADRQREARLLAKFQYRAEFWLTQSRTGYSDSLFPVVMDDVEKSVAVPAADSTVALTDEEKHILGRSSNDANPEPGPPKATDDSSRWRAQQHHSEGIEHAPREQRQFEGFLHELAGHLFLVREPGEIARIYAHGSGANAR